MGIYFEQNRFLSLDEIRGILLDGDFKAISDRNFQSVLPNGRDITINFVTFYNVMEVTMYTGKMVIATFDEHMRPGEKRVDVIAEIDISPTTHIFQFDVMSRNVQR